MNGILITGLVGMAASAALIIVSQHQLLRHERWQRRKLLHQVDHLARLARHGGAA